jgi:GNAT superfamily N-acetyltransferase
MTGHCTATRQRYWHLFRLGVDFAPGILMVNVRLANTTDIEQILAIDPSASGEKSRLVFIKSAVENHESFVAEGDGIIVGYGVMNYAFFSHGFVPLIYVDTAHRRSRVGSALFDRFEGQCRTTRIFTSTNLSNLPMQAFLASRGYDLSGLVQYLDENDPELFYSKKVR